MESLLALLIVILLIWWFKRRSKVGVLNDRIASLESRISLLEKRADEASELSARSAEPEALPAWGGCGLVLFNYELGRVFAVTGRSALILILLLVAHQNNDRDFRFQSHIIAILLFARSWATNQGLDGSLYGISDRYLVTLPALPHCLLGRSIIKKREKI
ncbi:MAG: hypothetical protein GY703_19730 [Gammaproteobacteria bacterium]|nr:hypothetical protein [Gammaproteobacteria bacterium]